MNATLTPLQAYFAMTIYLDSYYNHTKSDDIGLLVGGMQFVENRTADPSAWNDWIDVIDTTSEILTITNAFLAMKKYLHNYAKRISSNEVKAMLEKMQLPSEMATTNSVYWYNWVECWKIVTENAGDAKIIS